jgi:hypothetical protein
MQNDPSEIQKLKERVENLEKMHSPIGHYGILVISILVTMYLTKYFG